MSDWKKATAVVCRVKALRIAINVKNGTEQRVLIKPKGPVVCGHRHGTDVARRVCAGLVRTSVTAILATGCVRRAIVRPVSVSITPMGPVAGSANGVKTGSVFQI